MIRRLALAALALSCACGGSQAPRKLVLLHTNDEHSHLLGFGPEADEFPVPTVAGSGSIKGGASRRSAVFAKERADASAVGAAVLTVSAGDNMMGTLVQIAETTAAPDYRVMKMQGYDVTTLGNHEFDYGPAALAKIIQTGMASPEGIPAIVASNIHFSRGGSGDSALAALFDESGTDTTKPLHRSFVVKASNGLKVGFVGIMGADAASIAPLKAPITFSLPAGVSETDRLAVLSQLYDDVQTVVDSLRHTQGVDLVVALSHSGLDPANPAKDEDELIAANVSGIDVIVSGHTHTEARSVVTNARSGAQVLVQQAGRYGDHVGRIALTVGADKKVSFDLDRTKLVPVDDSTVPADAAVNALVGGVISALETQPVAAGQSFLQYTLFEILQAGQPLPSAPGKLAFKSVAGLDFDVDNTGRYKETELLDLVADADLAAARSVAPTDMAATAAGIIRVPLLEQGKTHQLAFADVFRAVSLGASPAGTPGYPLCRFGIYLAEVKAAFEITAGYAYAGHEDLFLIPSGYRFEYDTSRPAFNANGSATDPANGRVTKITKAKANDPDSYDPSGVVFDLSKGGWLASPLSLVIVTADLYITTFASFAGVTLKDPQTGQPLPGNNAASTILKRNDGSEIKDWEALGAYAHTQALAAPGGNLPHRYLKGDPSGPVPRRAICSGPLCL